ncbi:hypothetical protein DESC_710057 [Desulfosarcina cetonica]|nr:hypothetical protein DESC_710057 [Desulfosarcina cetonica]
MAGIPAQPESMNRIVSTHPITRHILFLCIFSPPLIVSVYPEIDTI